MKKMELGRYYEKEALKLIEFDLEDCKNIEEFKKLSNQVLEHNDPFMSWVFTKRTSWICNHSEAYFKALNVPAHEKIVVKSGDEAMMYYFARDVYGADLKNITFNMPKNSSLRKELEKDMRPIDEFEL